MTFETLDEKLQRKFGRQLNHEEIEMLNRKGTVEIEDKDGIKWKMDIFGVIWCDNKNNPYNEWHLRLAST